MVLKNVNQSVLRQLVSSEELCDSLRLSVVSRDCEDGVEYFIRLELSDRLICFESSAFSFYDRHFRGLLLDLNCKLADTILENKPF